MNSATAVQEHEEEREQKPAQSGKQKPSSECDEHGKQTKARKPYTITKARERWTDHEHSRFLEGLQLFGRCWGKVAQHVQTKTTIQIRSHAQKYFNRVKKQQECQPSSTTWQAGSNRSQSFLQSWQGGASTVPLSNGITGNSKPFQRAAEIVAAAATEAAAAAASVVVSAASKKIREQLDSLYSSQASAPDLCGNLAALPAQHQAEGMQTATGTESAKEADDSARTLGDPHAQKTSVEGIAAEGVQQSMVNSMQSIESTIVFKAMQRISSLFQQEPAANHSDIDAAANPTDNKPMGQSVWLPGSGGSSAFIPLANGATQATSEGNTAANAPAAPDQTTLHQPTDGAFCGDSDVVGDVQKEVNSGGGTSQAFSEVGVDGNRKRDTPTQPTATAITKAASPDDSGSSHVSEPPQKRTALQHGRDAGPRPAAPSSAPTATATSWPPTAHMTPAGRASVAQSLQQQGCQDPRFSTLPERVVLSLGPTLQALHPTCMETQTLEYLAPTSCGVVSVNKPPSDGTQAADGKDASNGNCARNAQGIVKHGLTSSGTAHNSTSSIANGSNDTSILACNAANKNVHVLPHIASATGLAASWGNVPTNSVLAPEQLLTAEGATGAALLTSASAQPVDEHPKVKPEAQTASRPTPQAVQLPLAAFTAVQRSQQPPWAQAGAASCPPAAAALPQPFTAAVLSLPDAVMQAGLLAAGGQERAAASLAPALAPTDATGMGWWPPGMSMKNLVNLMVGSQMASQFKQAPTDMSSGLRAAHEPVDAAVHAEEN